MQMRNWSSVHLTWKYNILVSLMLSFDASREDLSVKGCSIFQLQIFQFFVYLVMLEESCTQLVYHTKDSVSMEIVIQLIHTMTLLQLMKASLIKCNVTIPDESDSLQYLSEVFQ